MAIQDLNEKFSIVDPNTGKPTTYLLRLLRDRGSEVSSFDERITTNETNIAVLTATVDSIDGTVFSAGAGLAGGGTLGSDDPISFSFNGGLDDLSDVDLTTTPPTNGQVLQYVAADSEWVPGTVTTTVALDDLTDVDTTTTPPTDGQALVYDNASSTWIPGDVAAGGGSGTLSFDGAVVKPLADITAVNASAGYLIPFDEEVYDTLGFHDNSTNNTRLTVPSGVSRVRLLGSIQVGNITAGQIIAISVWKNGAALDPVSVQIDRSTATLVACYATVSTPVLEVTPGDYFEFRLFCGDTSVTIKEASTQFAIEVVSSFVGPSVYAAQDDSTQVFNPMPTTATAMAELTIPASSSDRTFVVSGMIVHDIATRRGRILLDGANYAGPRGVDSLSNGDASNTVTFSGVVVEIPGDGASHTLAVSLEAQANTLTTTVTYASISAIEVNT